MPRKTTAILAETPLNRNVCCFVCGYNSSEFITVNSQPDSANRPFFPFLLNQDPAEGSAELTESGTALVCLLCSTFLLEQWSVYDDGLIHRQKRLYWMKRPELTRKFTTREKQIMKTLVVMDTQDTIAENGVKPLGELVFSTLKTTNLNSASKSSPKAEKISPEIVANGVIKQVSAAFATNVKPNVLLNAKSVSSSPLSCLKSSNDEEISCYLCNDRLLFSERRIILTDSPPERNLTTRYYPCFRNIKPPHSTKVHIKNGDIFACTPCEDNLKAQWAKFDKAEIPIDLRVYSLRYSDHSFCYSCGSIFASHGNDLSLTCDICYANYCQICRQGNKSKDKMSSVRLEENDEFKSLSKFFPHKVRKTTACEKCMGYFLVQKNFYDQQKVALNSRAYTLPLMAGLLGTQSQKQIICYLCGEGYKSTGKIYYLFGDKRPNDDKTPFFPLLKSLNPAEGAQIISKEGMILSCRFCYHNLVSQWNWYELAKDNRPKSMRSYSLNICCVVCTKSVARPKVRVIGKSQFPFLTEITFDPRCIVLDNFDTVVVCNPCERTLIMQWLDYEKRSVMPSKRDYQVSGKTFKCPTSPKDNQNSDPSSKTQKSTSSTELESLGNFPKSGVFASGKSSVSPKLSSANEQPSSILSNQNAVLNSQSLVGTSEKILLQAAAAMYPSVASNPFILNAATSFLSNPSNLTALGLNLQKVQNDAQNLSSEITCLEPTSPVKIKVEPDSTVLDASLPKNNQNSKSNSISNSEQSKTFSANSDTTKCENQRKRASCAQSAESVQDSKVSRKDAPLDLSPTSFNLCTASWDDLIKSTNMTDSDEVRKLEIEHCKLQLLHDNYQKKIAELSDAEKPLKRQLQLVSSLFRQINEDSL